MSLQQPKQKMSKSHGDPQSTVLLSDSAEAATAKITAALTDSTNGVSYDPDARPGVANLLDIWAALDIAGRPAVELARDLDGAPLRELKARVAAAVVEAVAPIRARFLEILSRDGGAYVDRVAAYGTARARANAAETMERVRSAVGLS